MANKKVIMTLNVFACPNNQLSLGACMAKKGSLLTNMTHLLSKVEIKVEAGFTSLF